MKLLAQMLIPITAISFAGCGNNASTANSKDSTEAITESAVATDQIAVNPLKDCFFGDLHLHSSYSADAFAMGARMTPEDAYNWAEGKTLNFMGKQIQRKAPLDFLALTDHGEYLGIMPEAADPKGQLSETDWGKGLTDPDPKAKNELFRKLVQTAAANKRIDEFEKPELIKSVWDRYTAVADANNTPGKFTAFVAYEWTSAPGNQNMHRCIIFKGKGPEIPFTTFDSQDPEMLWDYLDHERSLGHDVIAIPHNGNISNGLMFDAAKTYAGGPITYAYAKRRMVNEPLFEMIQEKGASETHPKLSPNDEFANFEIYRFMLGTSRLTTKSPHFETGSYIRQAYGKGQEINEKIGANPFKFGIEAGTDNHAGMSSTEEFNFQGQNGITINNHLEALETKGDGAPDVYTTPGGLTGVWAESNTRESIFDALQHKETFGTSGVRIKVRFFASWNFSENLTSKDGWVKEAYASGVPMGSDLLPSSVGKVPTFAIQAIKDPESGNLDRVQVIKVSTKNGKSTEKVIDVLWSGDRKPDLKTGKLPPVGNTVDITKATYTNTIGAAELTGTWTDKDFDPAAQVTYYVRVLEIPTPRWSAYWALKEGVKLDPAIPAFIQERAWTSPVWYTPAK